MCKWRSRAWAGRDRTKVDAFCVLQWKARVRCGAPPSLGGEALKYWHTSKFDKISAQHKKNLILDLPVVLTPHHSELYLVPSRRAATGEFFYARASHQVRPRR